MRAGDVRQVDLPDDPHPHLRDPLARAVEILEVEEHHVATVATGPLEMTPGSRTRFDRRDDLQKAVADGEDGVRQAKLADAGVAKGLVEPEQSLQTCHQRLELSRDEHGLSKPYCWSGLTHPRRLAAILRAQSARGGRGDDNHPIEPDPEDSVPERPHSGLERARAKAAKILPEENPAGAIYGVIVIGALLAGESGRHETYLDTISSAVVAAALYWLAHAYAGLLGRRLSNGERLTTRALAHALWHDLAVIRGSAIPLIALILAAACGAGVQDAVTTALWSAVASLVGLELLAGLRSGASRGELLLDVSVGMAMGLAILALKILLH
jgi:hypothetical protein